MSASMPPYGLLNPPLAQGIGVLSGSEAIPFVQYVRHVLPLDGFVFWLRTQQTVIQGSLHIGQEDRQNEDENLTVNRVWFTTTEEVDCFNDINPQTIWVGEYEGARFAFSTRGPYYDAAGLFHYAGEAVYPAMESQLVDVGAELSNTTLVVSNSLPAWLALASYNPIWLLVPNPAVTLYPSFAVPANLRPPYGSVHIDPALTKPLQGAPAIGSTGTHEQLAADHVRITFYGLTNDQIMNWFETLNQYSYDTNIIGMMAPSIVRDGKRGQVGLDILAMQKIMEFDVSYNQASLRDVARQLIVAAASTMLPQYYPVPL